MTRLEFHTSTLWREASIEWQYYLAGEHGACRHMHTFRAQPMMHHAPHHGIAGTDPTFYFALSLEEYTSLHQHHHSNLTNAAFDCIAHDDNNLISPIPHSLSSA